MKTISVANRKIGNGFPCFIIAEAGVNHNGRLDLALKLIDEAKSAGADAVKFQTAKAEEVTIGANEMAAYQKKNLGYEKSQLEMIKSLILKEDYYPALIERCEKLKIFFSSTPHGGENSVDFLEKFNLPFYKIASGDITNLPFLEYVSKKKKPIVMSTGMSTLKEVEEAVKVIKKNNSKLILLHCTTNYPTPLVEVNLKAMQTMQSKFNLLIGYSDHTTDIIVPFLAVAMGACVIEKHFTLDKSLPGPDHKASLEPDELKKMIDMVRQTEKIMGSRLKKPTKSEIETAKIARKSIVSIKSIKKGEIIKSSMLYVKRPGTGIHPKYLSRLIGIHAKKNIPCDSLIPKEAMFWK